MAEDTRTATSADANAAQGALPRRGVFWRFAARSLRLNRSRTIVCIIGIALSCALITAIFTSVATLYEGLLKAEIVTEGAWQVELVNVPEDEIDVVHADSRVTRSYDRISYGDAIMPKSFEGYWGRYLSVQEWPTADKVKGLKPLPHIAEGRAPQAPDEIVLTHNLKGLTVENGSWLYDNLPTTGRDDDVPAEGRAPQAPDEIVLTHNLKGLTVENGSWLYDNLPTTGRDDDVPRAAWNGDLEIGSVIDLALGERTFVDAESGQEAPCLYDESLYTTESATGDVISEYLANPGEVKSYKVVGFYAPEGIRKEDVWGQRGPGYLGFVSSPNVPVRTTSIYLTTNLKSRTEVDALIEDYTGSPHAIFNGGGNRDDIENMDQRRWQPRRHREYGRPDRGIFA